MADDPIVCANEVLSTIPPLMGSLRANMHRTGIDLTVPQFRALACLRHHHQNCSLSALADCLDLSLPAASKLIDHLVAKSLVARHTDPDDRRRVTLVVTPAGRVVLDTAHAAGQRYLAETLATLDEVERIAVVAGMRALRRAFAAGVSTPTPAAAASAAADRSSIGPAIPASES